MNFKHSAITQKAPKSADTHDHSRPEKVQVPLWMKALLAIFAVAIFGGGLTIYALGSNVYQFITTAQDDPLGALLDIAGTELETDQFGRTNIVLLGGGGKEYDEGSGLTDSIIVASINHDRKDVTMISIPRDLVVIVPDPVEYHRINLLYELGRKRLGEEHKEQLLIDAIENALCMKIQYYAAIDFGGFTKVIDALGGVNVDVERQFTDYQYPTENYGYQTVHFEQGIQTMNGEQALQYARSRHGTNGEASDFARAARQQRLLQAIAEKAKSINLLSDAEQIQALIEVVNDHYETNIAVSEVLTLANTAKKLLDPVVDETTGTETPVDPSSLITSVVLHDGPDGLLYTPTEEVRNQYYDGAFVLLPDGDNFETVCAYIQQVLHRGTTVDLGPAIEVLNGTSRNFLARDVGAFLVKQEYNIKRRDNTFQQRRYDKTYIYDHSRGGNIDAIMDLQSILGGEVVANNTEPVLVPGIDITVVLGDDFVFPEGGLGAPTLYSEGTAITQ